MRGANDYILRHYITLDLAGQRAGFEARSLSTPQTPQPGSIGVRLSKKS